MNEVLNLSKEQLEHSISLKALQSVISPNLALAVHRAQSFSPRFDPQGEAEQQTEKLAQLVQETGSIPQSLWAFQDGPRALRFGSLSDEASRFIPQVYRNIEDSQRMPSRRSLGDYTALANAIQTMEGYYPGSLAYTNNNPGNLMPAGQPGCSVGQGGFCSFPTYQDGYQALLNQVSLDASRGLTIEQFAQKYAPASAGNNPDAYAQFLASNLGLSVNDPLSDASTVSSDGSGDGSTILSDLFGTSDSGTLTVSLFGTDVPVSYLLAGGIGLFALLMFAQR